MTTIDPESTVNLGILDPAYLHNMGEPVSSIVYLRECAGLPANRRDIVDAISVALVEPAPMERL